MKIIIASLTLRFYKIHGWDEDKVRELLVNPEMEITYRKNDEHKELFGDISYYAVYEESGYKAFKASEMKKHKVIDKQNFNGIDWYLNEEE